MRPKLILAGLGALWPIQGLAYSAHAQHQDAGSVPVACSYGPTADQVPPEVSPLRPRQDLDVKVAAKAAIDAMNNKFYSSSQAIWSPDEPWWLSGFALTAVIDFMRKTKSTIYVNQVKNIIQAQRARWNGDFRAESTDDTGWWALAMVRMYDLTGDGTYLDIAKKDEAYMYKSWSSSPCGGGMFVDIKAKAYKNAIANELYIKLAASLHNRVPNDTTYLSRAETAWSWFQDSGMINDDNLINDGLAAHSNGTCFNNKLPVWTYNQGVILGALVELHHATSTPQYLTTALTIASAVFSSTQLTNTTTSTSTSHILTESSCNPPEASNGCNQDQQIFKGIFAANLAELAAAVVPDDHPSYGQYLQENAASAYEYARQEDLYDVCWAGPFRGSTVAKQASVVGLLVACL